MKEYYHQVFLFLVDLKPLKKEFLDLLLYLLGFNFKIKAAFIAMIIITTEVWHHRCQFEHYL